MNNFTILGIDPALLNMGWGIINTSMNTKLLNYVSSGLIQTKSNILMHSRLAYIVMTIEKIIQDYNPNIICMEETFINNNAVSSMKLSYVRGAIMSIIGKYNTVQYFEFKPNLIKKTTTGTGHATKYQMHYMISKIINNISEKTITFDEADALSVAYTGYIYCCSSNNK